MISLRNLLKRLSIGRQNQRRSSYRKLTVDTVSQQLEVRSLLSATIQGQIWEDLDLDGLQQSNEENRNGVRVDLLSLSGAVQQTTVTSDVDLNDDGQIDPSLERGIYQFHVDNSAAYTVSPSEIGFFATTFPLSARKVDAKFTERVDVYVMNEAMGTAYASGQNGTVFEYHIASNAIVREFEIGEAVSALAVSPDGRSLAVAERSLRDDLVTLHVIDLQTGDTSVWQHNPSGAGSGIWELAWSADQQLFVSLAVIGSGNDRQLLSFDLDSKQFSVNRTVSFSSDLVSTVSGQRTILTGLSSNQDAVALYSAATGSWTDISTDVARIRSSGVIASNVAGDRFVINSSDFGFDEVVDEKFETLFPLPVGFRTFGFRSSDDSLLGKTISPEAATRYDSTTGTSLSIDFYSEDHSPGRPVSSQGSEYFVTQSNIDFQRTEAALTPSAPRQIFVQANLADEAIVPAIGTAAASIIVNPQVSMLHLNEGDSAQQLQVLLSQKPTADVVIDVSLTDSTEVGVDQASITVTPANWQTPQTLLIHGLDDDLLDGRINSTLFLSVNSSGSAAEFANVPEVTFQVSTFDSDSGLRGRVSSNAHIYGTNPSDVEYLDGVTIDLFDKFNNLVATTETMSYDINQNGTIEEATEQGWYRFDLLDPGYYTVIQRGIGPAGQPTDGFSRGSVRWIESTAFETGVIDPVRPYAYATTEAGDVARQDTRADREALVLDVGERARGVAVSEDGEFLYVGEGAAQTDGFQIHRLNLATLQYESIDVAMVAGEYSVKELKLRPSGQLVASIVDANGRHTILSLTNLTSAVQIDVVYEADSYRPIVEFSGDGNRMLLARVIDDTSALLYDLQTKQVIAGADPSLQPIAMNAAADRFFAQTSQREALLLDGNFQILHRFGQFSAGAAFSSDHETMFLGNGLDSSLQRIDLATLEVIDSRDLELPNTGRPMTFQLNASEDDLLVNDQFLYVYRIDSHGGPASVYTINLAEAESNFQLNFARQSPQVSVSVADEGFSLKEEDAASRTLEFRLSHAPTSDVQITVSGTDASELNVEEQTFVFTAADWMQDRTVTVRAVDDDLPDGDRQSHIQFQIDVAASDPLYAAAGVNSVPVTTLDNENLLSGRIWQDANGDGILNAGEVGRNGRTIELLDLDLNVLQTTISASVDFNQNGQIEPETETGWYSFANTTEGDLFVRQTDVNQQGQTRPSAAINALVEEFDIRQHTYSAVTDIVYAPDFRTGEIHRYHVSLQLQLNPIQLGGRPNSIDISPDGQTLWIGDATSQSAPGLIRQFDLLTGDVRSFSFQQNFPEAGVNELVVMDNGSILFTPLTSRDDGRLLHLDPTTGTVSNRQEFNSATFLSRSADHRTAVVMEAAADKTVYRYDSLTDRLNTVGQLQIQGAGQSLALNQDGQFLAFETNNSQITIFNRSLQQLLQIGDSRGDFVFHPSKPILFLLSNDGRSIQSFDAITGQQIGTFALNTQAGTESRFSMNISDDGRHVILESFWGLQIVKVSELSSDVPPAAAATVQNGDFIDTLDLGIANPGIAFYSDPASQVINEGETATVGLIRLTERPEADVRVTISNSDAQQLSVQETAYHFTANNWNQWQPLVGSAIVDSVADGDQTVDLVATVDAANSHSAFADADPVNLNISVVDIDVPGIAVGTFSGLIQEGGDEVEISVSLLQAPDADVSLLVSSDAPDVVAVQPSPLLFTTDNWNVPQSITLQAIQNGRITDVQSVTVSISVDDANSSAGYADVEDQTISVNVGNSNILDVEQWYPQADGTTRVSWVVPDANLQSGPFEVQIVRLQSTPEIIYSRVVESGVSFVDVAETIDNGTYRIWVRGTLEDGSLSPWSNRTVVRNAFPFIEPTEYQTSTDDLQVQWNAVPGAASYRVFVSNVSAQQTGIVDITVAETSVTLPEIKQLGRLRIWVQAVTADGLRSPWSPYEEVSLLVEGISPKFHFEGNSPRFQWTEVPGATSYEFYLAGLNSSFQMHLKDLTSSGYRPEAPLESGAYRWWVRGITATGRPTMWSEGDDVTLGSVTLLTQETLASNENTPAFQWYFISTATSYDVYIQEAFGSRTVTRYFGLTDTSVQLAPLNSGRHNVWVRAVDEDGEGVWGPRTSYVAADAGPPSTFQSVETAPVIFDEDLHLSFTSTEPIPEFDIILIGPEQNRLLTNLRYVTSPTQMTFFRPLPEGPYQWAVRHRTEDGQIGQWKYGNDFRNDGRIPLDLPATFSEDSVIAFSWPAVNDSVRYVIQIDNLNTGQQSFQRIDDLTSPQYQSSTTFPKARYRVWVRAILSTGQLLPWSRPDEFEVV